MSYVQLTDYDMQEAFYASDLMAQLSMGRDDPMVLLDALRRASESERSQIAYDCAAKGTDVAIGLYGGDEEMEPGWIDTWAEQLSHIACELRRHQEPRNAWPHRGA